MSVCLIVDAELNVWPLNLMGVLPSIEIRLNVLPENVINGAVRCVWLKNCGNLSYFLEVCGVRLCYSFQTQAKKEVLDNE